MFRFWWPFLLCSLCSSNGIQASALWQDMIDVSNQTFEQIFLPRFLTAIREDRIRPHPSLAAAACNVQLQQTITGLQHRQTWAVAMFNSWGRIPPAGFVRGTLVDYGDWDQCVAVSGARYCLLDIQLPMPDRPAGHNLLHATPGLLPPTDTFGNGSLYRHLESVASIFHYGWIETAVCVPDACTESDLADLVRPEVRRLGLQFKAVRCDRRHRLQRWTPVQMLAGAMLVAVCIVTLMAMIYDRRNRVPDSQTATMLQWFNPIRNMAKLLSTAPGSSDELACIHGIRVLTILWIIVGHTLDWNNVNVFRDSFTIKDRLSDLSKQPLLRTHFAVETFFYLSGLLTAYMSFLYCDGLYRNFNKLSYLALRYIRLTPQLAAFMLLSSLLPGLFDGPLWSSYLDRFFGPCPRTWWHNLIYLQNIIDNDNICSTHTWYLAADMQLHWLALLPVIVWLIRPSWGRTLTAIMAAGGAAISGWLIYRGGLPPGYVVTAKGDFLDEHGRPSPLVRFFHKPWAHASVFLVGFLMGAYLYRRRPVPVKLTARIRFGLWLAALLAYLGAIYSNSLWLYGRPHQPSISALVFTLNRLTWAALLTAVIWLSVTGNGTIVSRVLCWPAFRPLSRLTYTVYLVHVWVFIVAIGTRRTPIDIATAALAFQCAGIIMVSYLVALVFALLFECPLINALDWLKTVLAARHKMLPVATGNV